MSKKPLFTTEEAELLRQKVLENARELLEEAQLLYGAEKAPRAFALAHLASEELMKLPMIVSAAFSAEVGEPVDWAKLERRLRTHSEKIDSLHLFDYALTPLRQDVDAYFRALETKPRLNTMKNASLYSGRFEGKIQRPSEIISLADAREAIEATRFRFEMLQEAEQYTRGKIKFLASLSGVKERYAQAKSEIESPGGSGTARSY